MNWDKLKNIRELLNLSQAEISAKTGINQKDISLLEGGKKKFIPNEYIQFLYNSNIDINSLFDDTLLVSFKKEAYTPHATTNFLHESEMIYTHSVSPTTPKTVSPTVSPTRNFGLPSVVTVAEDGKELVPFVPVKAAAGYLNKYADEGFIQALPAMRLHGFRNGTYRAFEVEGHSMLPTIHNGSIAVGEWVESVSDIRDRRIYIIVTDVGIVIKRVVNRLNSDNKLILISDNANKVEYPNSHVSAEQIKEVWYLRGALQFTFTEPSEIHGRINELEGKVSILYDLYKQQKG